MADYNLQFSITPKVLKGGTYEGIDYTPTSSIFKLFNSPNTTLAKKNEDIRVHINFNYTVTETDDEIILTLKGIDSFRFMVIPVATNGVFGVRDVLYIYDINRPLFDRTYQSGTNTTIDTGVLPGYTFNDVVFRISKSGEQQSYRVNKYLVRFDDRGLQSSIGDNYIELWLDSIIYIPPPDIKPWAVRKSGVFKTISRPSGWFKIRKSGNWSDKSKQKKSDVKQPNKGSHRIRKSGTWLGQNKIGET